MKYGDGWCQLSDGHRIRTDDHKALRTAWKRSVTRDTFHDMTRRSATYFGGMWQSMVTHGLVEETAPGRWRTTDRGIAVCLNPRQRRSLVALTGGEQRASRIAFIGVRESVASSVARTLRVLGLCTFSRGRARITDAGRRVAKVVVGAEDWR